MTKVFYKESCSKVDVENTPKIFVSQHPRSGRKIIDVGLQNVKKIISRFGVSISVFNEIDESGKHVTGVKIETIESTGWDHIFDQFPQFMEIWQKATPISS